MWNDIQIIWWRSPGHIFTLEGGLHSERSTTSVLTNDWKTNSKVWKDIISVQTPLTKIPKYYAITAIFFAYA